MKWDIVMSLMSEYSTGVDQVWKKQLPRKNTACQKCLLIKLRGKRKQHLHFGLYIPVFYLYVVKRQKFFFQQYNIFR